jgi:hypothetical protein
LLFEALGNLATSPALKKISLKALAYVKAWFKMRANMLDEVAETVKLPEKWGNLPYLGDFTECCLSEESIPVMSVGLTAIPPNSIHYRFDPVPKKPSHLWVAQSLLFPQFLRPWLPKTINRP